MIPGDGFLDPKRRFLYTLLCNMIKYALCVLFLGKHKYINYTIMLRNT